MLAIKECLIREGVLNLAPSANINANDTANSVNSNRSSGTLDAVNASGDDNSKSLPTLRSKLHCSNRNRNDNYNYSNNNKHQNSHNRAALLSPLSTLDAKLAALSNQISVTATQNLENEANSAVNTSNNLSSESVSASATANTSCQQITQGEQSQLQQPKQQEQNLIVVPTTLTKTSSSTTASASTRKSPRYQGLHPHFHHHTAPAYYTDVNLRIHTPKAADGAALNEHYQSVYGTPSQLVNERYFPKTSTATVVPPPIGTGTASIGKSNSPPNVRAASSAPTTTADASSARAAFFRGGSAGNELQNLERSDKLSPTFAKNPTKGELNTYTPFDVDSCKCSSNCSRVDAIASPSSLSLVPCTCTCNHSTADHHHPLTLDASTVISPPTSSTSSRSRPAHRFISKKRAVRVRSESRPISALYDIICKEKGLDIGTSTTNDEDSSSTSSTGAAGVHNRTHRQRRRNTHSSNSLHSINNYSNSNDNSSEQLSTSLTTASPNLLGKKYGKGAMLHRRCGDTGTSNSVTLPSNERPKRSHKARNAHANTNSTKTKKRKDKDVDHGKDDVQGPNNCSADTSAEQVILQKVLSDEENGSDDPTKAHNGHSRSPALIERSQRNAIKAHAPEAEKRIVASEKAASLPPRLCNPNPQSHQCIHQCFDASTSQAVQHNHTHHYCHHSLNRHQCPVHPMNAYNASPDRLVANTSPPVPCLASRCDPNAVSLMLSLTSTPPACYRQSLRMIDYDEYMSGDAFNKLYVEPVVMNTPNCNAVSVEDNNSARSNNQRGLGRLPQTQSTTVLVNTETVSGPISEPMTEKCLEDICPTPAPSLAAIPSIPPEESVSLDLILSSTLHMRDGEVNDAENGDKAAGEADTNTDTESATAEKGTQASDGEPIRATNARRFINRPSRTPSRGRSRTSLNGISPPPHSHPLRRHSSSAISASTPSPPPPSLHQNITSDGSSLSTPLEPEDSEDTRANTNRKCAKFTQTLPDMTNSAMILAVSGGMEAPHASEVTTASSTIFATDSVNDMTINNANGAAAAVTEIPTAAPHTQHNNSHSLNHSPSQSISSKSKLPILSNTRYSQYHNQHKSNRQPSHEPPKCNHTNNYAQPTETSLMKQKHALTNGGIATPSCPKTNNKQRSKPLSPLIVGTTPTRGTLTPSPPSSVLSPASLQQPLRQPGPPLRQSPLSGTPPTTPHTPHSPHTLGSPHYVRPTKASRLRAAALEQSKIDKKKEEDTQHRSTVVPETIIKPSPFLTQSKPHELSCCSSTESENLKLISSDSEVKEFQNYTNTSDVLQMYSTTRIEAPDVAKKLIPSMSISLKQNLSELQYNGKQITVASSPTKKTAGSNSKKSNAVSTECSAKFLKSGGKLSPAEDSEGHTEQKYGTKTTSDKPVARPRSTTIKTSKFSVESKPTVPKIKTPERQMEQRDKSSKRKSNLNRSLNEEVVAENDDIISARRRRRRELGMVRQLIPTDDPVLREILLPPQLRPDPISKQSPPPATNELAYHMEVARRGWDLVNPFVVDRSRANTTSPKFDRLHLTTRNKTLPRVTRRSGTLHLGELRKLRSNDVNRKLNERTKSDLAEIRKIAELANADIDKLTSSFPDELIPDAVKALSATILPDSRSDISSTYSDEVAELVCSKARSLSDICTRATGGAIHSYFSESSPLELDVASMTEEREPSPAKHATFTNSELIYYETETSDELGTSDTHLLLYSSNNKLRQRVLKARSMERDAGHEEPRLSPILRRRSTDDPSSFLLPSSSSLVSTSPSVSTHNHIVSILKKKDHIAGESSSASSNASPVTFSANVVDTPTSKPKRAGILKKRSSLDESRYYSRSHSPDERSILVKSARRNSLEEMAGTQQQHHGILKQSSYDSSKSDGCPSATEVHPHGILKKKDSTSTPSDGGSNAPKHVSISQAVILAAAELCRAETANGTHATEYDDIGYTPSNEEYEIRPILKLETTSNDDVMRPPKPILKKKSSGDSDEHEIRPILKTSRKSSREEFDLSGSQGDDSRYYNDGTMMHVRPILKTDSPSKRRSLGSEQCENSGSSGDNARSSPSLLKRRTRSLERQEAPVIDLAEALNAIATSQAAPMEFVSTPVVAASNMSVAERIKNMERVLNGSWESPLHQLHKPSVLRREMCRDRYKTQPVTSNEKLLFKASNTTTSLDSDGHASAFKPAQSLEAGLNYSSTPPSDFGCSYAPVRSATQALQQFTGITTIRKRLNSSRSNSLSISEQLTLSLGSDNERIFDMSGIDDSSLQANENYAANATTNATDSNETVDSDGDVTGGNGSSLMHRNSVRARANMFQLMQEQSTTPRGRAEERPSPSDSSTRKLSPSNSAENTTENITEEKKEEIGESEANDDKAELLKPTSLPVSERLRFFTNLTEANRSASSSFTRSPPQRQFSMEPCSSANSYNSCGYNFTLRNNSGNTSAGSSSGSNSARGTPTPMEYYTQSTKMQAELDNISITEVDTLVHFNGENRSSAAVPSKPAPPKPPRKRLASLTTTSIHQECMPHDAVPSRPLTPITPLTPPNACNFKAKTIGKIILPATFLNNDRNNNKPIENSSFNKNTITCNNNSSIWSNNNTSNYTSNTSNYTNNTSNYTNYNSNYTNNTSDIANASSSDSANDAGESNFDANGRPKKIGKIKSPFIENCLLMQQKTPQFGAKYMKSDLKSSPVNALASLENKNGENSGQRKPLLSSFQQNSQNNNNRQDECSTDSGKENYESNTPTATQNTTAVPEQQNSVSSPVREMNKKQSRFGNNPTISLPHPQQLQRNGGNVPTTPRSCPVIDDKYANYFGITPSGGELSVGVKQQQRNGGNVPITPRSCPVIDDKYAKYFGITPSGGELSVGVKSSTSGGVIISADHNAQTEAKLREVNRSDYSFLYTSSSELSRINIDTAPQQVINENANNTTNTPYFTPPPICADDASVPASNTTTTVTFSTPLIGDPKNLPKNPHIFRKSNAPTTSNAPHKRREMAKRPRSMTTHLGTTDLDSPRFNGESKSTPRTARTLRMSRPTRATHTPNTRLRSQTLTDGIRQHGVVSFEQIAVTKEELLAAAKEFDRIYSSIHFEQIVVTKEELLAADKDFDRIYSSIHKTQ